MNRKIIFFDIDGTIIGEESKAILESTRKAIQKARENGHYAVINTGRTDLLVGKELKEEIGFDGYLLGCGTSIKFGGKDLFHRTIPKETGRKIVEKLRSCKIDGVLEGEDFDYMDKDENIHSQFFRNFVQNFSVPCKSWDDEELSFDKLYTYTTKNSDLKSFQAQFCHEFDFIDREGGFYEIIPKGHSKATAIEYLVDYLGMSMEDTAAIGDSNNDLTMLSCVNTSIAMGNSTKSILDMADYVTSHVDEDGIWNALTWLGVI